MTVKASVMSLCLCILMIIAGLMMITAPLDQIPPLEWRAHYAITNWCFGAMSGIGIWQFLSSRLGPHS